jgi:hypothetical protein
VTKKAAITCALALIFAHTVQVGNAEALGNVALTRRSRRMD